VSGDLPSLEENSYSAPIASSKDDGTLQVKEEFKFHPTIELLVVYQE